MLLIVLVSAASQLTHYDGSGTAEVRAWQRRRRTLYVITDSDESKCPQLNDRLGGYDWTWWTTDQGWKKSLKNLENFSRFYLFLGF